MSEKVDTTLTKGVLRVIGSAVGASLGELTSNKATCKHQCCGPRPENVHSAKLNRLRAEVFAIAFRHAVFIMLSDMCTWNSWDLKILACACAGFLVMLRSGLATEPVALGVLGCVATFVVAPLSLTQYNYAAYLTLVAFHSLILCQYR